MQIPLVKGDKVTPNAEWSDALPLNMYAVPQPILNSDGYMISFPGLDIDAIPSSSSVGEDRGGIWVDVGDPNFDGHYRVSGTALIRVDNPGETSVNISDVIGILPGSGQCSLAYSFNNLAIVASGKLFYYNPTDGLREITDTDVGSPIDITWGQNLFVLTDGDVVYHSDPLDEENFLPLDFTVPEFRPDPSLGVSINEDSELIVFGTKSIEHFINAGAENFVYRPITQKAQRIGVTGTYAKKAYGNTYFMVGRRDNSQTGVYITESGTSQKVSSISIDRILSAYDLPILSDIIIDVIEIDGVVLCIIGLPDRTLCLNWTLSKTKGVDLSWSELSSSSLTDFTQQIPHEGRNYIYDEKNSKWLCGSRNFAAIYRLAMTHAAQVGRSQEQILYSPLIRMSSAKQQMAPSIDEFSIETIPGYGFYYDYADEDYETTVFISLTYNGVTYGKEWTQLYGRRHNYSSRFICRRLGTVNHMVGFKFRCYSKERLAFAYFDLGVS